MAIFSYYLLSPKRYAVFAGYNPNGTIEPYVITYLEGLKEITDGIVYITDSPINEKELQKLSHLPIIYQEHNRHNEYDWGSYKRGYNWLKENKFLTYADELIFANDSTFAPITSFKSMFYAMRLKPHLDFWGDLKNLKTTPHLQSYFLVFRPQVFNSPVFSDFINSIQHQPTRQDYINQYELRLTQTLEKSGFRWDCYLPYDKLNTLPLHDKNTHPIKLIKDYNHQFIKRRTFTNGMIIIEKLPYIISYLKTHHPQTYNNILHTKPLSPTTPTYNQKRDK